MSFMFLPLACLTQLGNPSCRVDLHVSGGLAVLGRTAEQNRLGDEFLGSGRFRNGSGMGNGVGTNATLGVRILPKETDRVTVGAGLAVEWSDWSHEGSATYRDADVLYTVSEEAWVVDLSPSLDAFVRLFGRGGLHAGLGASLPLFGHRTESFVNTTSSPFVPSVPPPITEEYGPFAPLGPEVWAEAGLGFGLFHPSLTGRVTFRQGFLGRKSGEATTQVLGAGVSWELRGGRELLP